MKLRQEHIDLTRMTVTLIDKRKGKYKERLVTFPTSLKPLMERLKASPGDGSGRVFRAPWTSLRTQVNRDLARACAALGIERFSSHGLRRRKATDLFADGRIGPKDYEAIMGHSHRMGMAVYAEENRDAQRAALEAVSIGVADPKPD